jgi:hypothetical protein
MPKTHVVKITITNNTSETLTKPDAWFDSGRVADGWSWPDKIAPGAKEIIECYERDSATAGCSGYVKYNLGEKGQMAIAFSNPSVGKNKLGVGLGSKAKEVWDGMTDHGYDPFVQSFDLGSVKVVATCQASGGDVNNARVSLAFG